jgi:ubiquinone/menaquinone biosynthesis C-methylase UbiE
MRHRLFASMYDRMSAPMERQFLGQRRQQLLAGLTGVVLDVGAGTGANVHYLQHAARVVAAEPDHAMRARLAARSRAGATPVRVPVEVVAAAAESLPYHDEAFDAVVFTLVLCTVTEPARALAEARRVLKPSGQLAVLEHVRGGPRLARWQDRIDPFWSRAMAGCHPNRDTQLAITQAGFTFEHVECFQPMPGWIPTSPMLEAVATPHATHAAALGGERIR